MANGPAGRVFLYVARAPVGRPRFIGRARINKSHGGPKKGFIDTPESNPEIDRLLRKFLYHKEILGANNYHINRVWMATVAGRS